MALKQRIHDDMKTALLGGHRFEGEVLRGLKAAILNEEVAQNKRDDGLGDATIEQIIAREVKKRHESATIYEENDRAESAEQERNEAEVLQRYLPTQLSEEELQAVVDGAIQQLGANGMSDMGKVIGVVKSKVGNTADGASVARIVKASLQ